MQKVLVIPDVHGRDFWKKPCEEQIDQVDSIVFLGDYLDPYEHEHISRKQAYKNFDQVIAFKQAHPHKVTLLIGNHDLHYMYKDMPLCTRYDEAFAFLAEEKFAQAAGLFQLAYTCEMGDRHYLFTHAGVTSGWYNAHQQEVGTLTADSLNALCTPEHCSDALLDVGFLRGGDAMCGSPVWADVREMLADETKGRNIPNYFQVFGHTQLDNQIITDTFACLDCRRAFVISEGVITNNDLTS